VVNAPITAVHSPFEGILASEARKTGDTIGPGEKVVTVRASRETRVAIQRLRAQLEMNRREQTALRNEIRELEDLDRRLQLRQDDMDTFAKRALELRFKALSAELEAKQVEARRAEAERDRMRKLASGGAVSQSVRERAEADAQRAILLVAQLEAERERITHDIAAVAVGLLPATGSEDGSYASQRRDEIAIRRADLRARLAVVSAKAASLKAELEARSAEHERLARFEPVSERGAIIWSAGPPSGASVARGDEIVSLLDCTRRFMEVVTSERAIASITAGDTAWVRLNGEEKPFEAEVRLIRGGGTQPETGRLAARPVRVPEGSISVLLKLPDANLEDPEMRTGYCDVGRTAEVRFDRGWDDDLSRRLNTWKSDLAALARTARYAFQASIAYVDHHARKSQTL
jgi:multidrug resistance efflux pump